MNQKEFKKGNIITRHAYYWRVWWAVIRKSLSKSLAYRFEFLSKLLRMVLIVVTQIILIQSIFAGGEYVSGWSIDEYYLLIGIYNFVNYMSWGIFNVNLWRIEEKILKGEFDFLLLLPTGSIFAAAFIEFFLDEAIASLSGIILISWYLVINWSSITLLGALGATLTIFFSMVIWFNMHLVVSSMNFLTVKNGLMDLLKNTSRIASFPVDIFSSNVKFILYSLFPVAFIAAVPTRVLSGVYSWEFVLYAGIVAVVTSFLTRMVWGYSIRSYTSFGG